MRLLSLPALVAGLALGLFGLSRSAHPEDSPAAGELEAGFAEVEITPPLKERDAERTVFLAGFGSNRRATGVHDPLRAMALVLRHGDKKIAVVSVDLVGYFLGQVERVRKRLPGFDYVLVSSTHNHEGPDTMGLWGRSPLQSGVDPAYLASVERNIVQAVDRADKARRPVKVRLGSVKAPELLHDGREPQVKHDELVTLAFHEAKTGQAVGVVVQWNCHPETLAEKNTLVSSDFVGPTVQHLKGKHRCPVVYLTGTVGGLMTSLHVPVRSKDGKDLKDGTFEKTERYGELVGEAADKALQGARPVRLTPFDVRTRSVYLPLANKLYLAGWQLGVFDRQAYLWTGDPNKATPASKAEPGKAYCLRTEVGYLRLGELEIAAVPGEIYPELVLGKVQAPADPGADFPDAPVEPALYQQMRGPHRMIIGLACDEIGYIIPKRQWDGKAPYCYGRKKAQYGEVNSLGPDTAPLLCEAFKGLVAGKK